MHKTCDNNHNIDFNRYRHSAWLQLAEGDASFVLFIGYCAVVTKMNHDFPHF